MSRFRSSAGNLAFADDEPQRWDRDRFERMRSRGPEERDHFRYQEHERVGPRGGHRDVAIEERIDLRSPRGIRFQERERFFEDDRFAPPARRRTDFMEEPIPAEVANRALAPYRQRSRSIVERDIVDVPVRRPRPQLLRRQSSLDTFDRAPAPRYLDDYRLPADIPIPLPIRRPRSPPRRYREEAFEEVRYRDLPDKDFDEYRDIRVRRSRHGRRRSHSRPARSARSLSSSSSDGLDEIVTTPAPPPIGKRGKTRLPKRLAHKKAVVEMGLPFEEEDDFIIVQRALQKEHIDTIIEKSKTYNSEKTVFKYTEEKEKTEEKKPEEKKADAPAKPPTEAPPPPAPPASEAKPPASSAPAPPPPPPAPAAPAPAAPAPADGDVANAKPGDTVVTTKTIIENIPAAPKSHRSPSPAPSHKSHKSHHHGEIVEERIVEEHNHIGGPLMIVDRGRSSDHDIRREIKALEAERRALKLEREADDRRYQAALIRDSDYEFIESNRIIERPRDRSVVRVEKDRKGRLALVRSAH